MTVTNKIGISFLFGPLVLLSGIGTAFAQSSGGGLKVDEVVVTAQRREQSLQEVPISIETVSGLEIQQQGFRDLNELANFSPSIFIDDSGFLSQDRSIRGFGTSGNALTLEQAVPIFVDGIHFGRPAQVKLAFMDPARVEVLKGPQPVYFGMNATAGAFSIISAGPTDEWEGYLDTEFGNNSSSVVNAAVGGPINDKWGIRVAGKYENADGFVTDVVTDDKLGGYENLGGRVILTYEPRDNLTLSFKAEYAEIDKDPEATVLCLTGGSLIYERNDDGTPAPPGEQGNERSIWASPPPQGVGWSNGYSPLTTNCASDLGDSGISNGGPFFAPPENIREENSNFGAIDARAAVDEWIRRVGVSDGLDDTNEVIESSNGYFGLDYTFANDIQLNWQTGWSLMDRSNSRDNSNSPFLMNYQNRGEDFDQYSTELRFTSAPGGVDLGGTNMEWMTGFLWQKTDLDFISNSPRPNVRRGLRFTSGGEDQEWKTLFATVTFNFMDGKASVDIGGRYTDLDKIGFIRGLAGQWIYDVRPCDPDVVVDGLNPPPSDPATCALHEDALQITAADAEFLLPGADVNNLWILPWRASRNTPLSWIGSRASAVGLTSVADLEGDGPYGPGRGGDFGTQEFDPQITLRFRPNENHSLFLRYAETFKAGGFDTGVTSINSSCDNPAICVTPYDNFRFEAESGDTIEIGSKGSLWDGRARYDVTLFETTFTDFQITVATGDPDDPFLNKNAGEQRVRGLEFSVVTAVTENFTFSFAGALMDGELTSFPDAGCTETELVNADTGPCISAAESLVITLERFGVASEDLEGTIDRSGSPAPKTPDWKFVLGADYEIPVLGDYMINLNAMGYISDGFITDINGFSQTVKMNQHEDLNLTLGFGPGDGSWQIAAYGRNLLEAKEEYNPEFEVRDNGIAGFGGTDGGVQMSRTNFRSYGVKFRYNF